MFSVFTSLPLLIGQYLYPPLRIGYTQRNNWLIWQAMQSDWNLSMIPKHSDGIESVIACYQRMQLAIYRCKVHWTNAHFLEIWGYSHWLKRIIDWMLSSPSTVQCDQFFCMYSWLYVSSEHVTSWQSARMRVYLRWEGSYSSCQHSLEMNGIVKLIGVPHLTRICRSSVKIQVWSWKIPYCEKKNSANKKLDWSGPNILRHVAVWRRKVFLG